MRVQGIHIQERTLLAAVNRALLRHCRNCASAVFLHDDRVSGLGLLIQRPCHGISEAVEAQAEHGHRDS